MAEAKITVTYSPREFDVTREVLGSEYQRCLDVANSSTNEPSVKSAHRKRAMELSDILGKLR